MSLHNFKCVENIEAGLGGVYIFQNKKENDKGVAARCLLNACRIKSAK